MCQEVKLQKQLLEMTGHRSVYHIHNSSLCLFHVCVVKQKQGDFGREGIFPSEVVSAKVDTIEQRFVITTVGPS